VHFLKFLPHGKTSQGRADTYRGGQDERGKERREPKKKGGVPEEKKPGAMSSFKTHRDLLPAVDINQATIGITGSPTGEGKGRPEKMGKTR